MIADGAGAEDGINPADTCQHTPVNMADPLSQLEQAKPLFNVLSEHVVFQDTEHTILWANRAAARSVDSTASDLQGKRCYRIWAHRNRPCPACPVETALRTGEPQQGETATEDGKTWLVRATPLRNADGDIVGTIETTLDVTEQKKREQRIRASAEEMRVISDTAMQLNTCGTIREICRLTGDAIRTFNPDAYVIVTAPDRLGGDIRIQYTTGFSPFLERLTRLVGMNPRHMTFSVEDMTEAERELFTAGRLVEMTGGLYALSTRKMPRPVCQGIERLLDIDAIYTMGFAIDHTPFGGVILLLPADGDLRHVDGVEALVRQAAAVVERKLAQEALQASEAHSQAVLDAIPDLMFHFDGQGTIIAYRGGREDLYRDPDEFMDKNIRDVMPGDLAELTLVHIERALDTGRVQRYEYDLPIQGTMRHFEARMAAADADSVVAVVRDITQRKRTEKALQQSEKKFRLIAENTSDYIAIINWKGEYLYASPSHRQLGYEPEELIGKSGLSMVHPDDRKKLLPLLKKYAAMKLRDAVGLYRKDITERLSFRFPDVEGTWHHVEATADLIQSPDGSELQILLVSRDVTKQKKLLEELKESEERFRTVFEHAMVGVYKTTPDGHILMANPAMLDMLGYDSFEELAQRNLEREGFEPGYDRERFKQEVDENDVVRGLESSWTRKDGTTLHVRENAKAIRDDSGDIQYYLGTVEDITERKQAEEQVARLNDTLRLINKIMRHDLLNHLNIAQSALELFEEDRDMSFCEKARSRMLQGMQLIKRMRELEALVGSGGSLRPYDLRDVVEEAVAGCPVDCATRGRGVIRADDAIYPMVENLVRNAVEHADATSIDISITRSNGRGNVELRIADDGTGIPDPLKEKVFEEQYSYGSSAGSGLGLYIVRQTVERYGGSIHVEDNKPRGTVFVMTLPGGKPAEATA
ncbi:MAG: PAS domain S-box protein [Thermoplasmatota archaeon]